MRVLIIGLGSIGTRHLLNIKKILRKDKIIILRSKKNISDPLFDYKFGTKTVYTFSDAQQQKPNIAFITNPTNLHVSYAMKAAQAGCHLFIEKPISHNLKNISRLINLAREKKLLTMVGCNQRFHPQLQEIKHIIDHGIIGRVQTARFEAGQYLPDWQPNKDYKKSYAGKKEMGGGVILTLIHELDFAYWLFGELKKIVCFARSSHSLKINTEDNAGILGYTKNGTLIEVHLDYLQRSLTRQYQFFGTRGSILWDYSTGKLKIYTVKTKKWTTHSLTSYNRNRMFVDELKYFMQCINKKQKTFNTIEDGKKVLKIALAAKKSNRYNKIINIT